MKRILFGALAVLLAAPLFAQGLPVSGSLSLTYATRDVWRGINLVDDSVLKGKVAVDFNSFHAYAEGRMEMTDTNSYPLRANPSGTITAVRGGLFRRFDNPSGVSFDFGVMTHQYPGVGSPQTWEAYYGFDFGGAANFNIAVIQDIEVVKGYRVVASASRDFPAGVMVPGVGGQNITLSASVAYGDSNYNSFYYGADTSTLTDMLIGASTSFDLGGYKVSPFLRYTSPLDPDILKGAANRTNLYAGVGVSLKF